MIGPTNASPKNTVLTDNVQTISAVKTFTASPIVPDTPSDTHAAVNQSYVESTVDGVNNLVHKTGNETVSGVKTMVNRLTLQQGFMRTFATVNTASVWNHVLTIPKSYNSTLTFLLIKDVTGGFAVLTLRPSAPSVRVTTKTNITTENIGIRYDADNVYLMLKNGAAYQPIFGYILNMASLTTLNVPSPISTYANISDGPGTDTVMATYNLEDDTVMTPSGSTSVGTDTKPIKVVNGVATAVTNDLVSTSGAQTVAGTKTFSSSPVVPDAPADTHSAVNQAYVESTVAGMNNLVHKSGDENISGIKSFNKIINYKNSKISKTVEEGSKWVRICISQENTSYNDHALMFYLIPRHTNYTIRQLLFNVRYNNKSVYLQNIVGSFDTKYIFGIRRVIRENISPLIELYVKTTEIECTIAPIISYGMGTINENSPIDYYTEGQTTFPGYGFYMDNTMTDLTDSDMTYIYDGS